MWNWLKTIFGGENIDFSPEAQWKRDADAEFRRWQEYNAWLPLSETRRFPDDYGVCLAWIKGGKPRHMEPMLPGSDPRIDAAYSRFDPSYMRGTSESEEVRRKRS